MYAIIYLIGYVLMLCLGVYLLKKDIGYVTVGYFVLCLFIAILSWVGIVIGLTLYLAEILNDLDFWNKKLF